MNLLEAVQEGKFEDVKANIDGDTWFQNTPWSDYILLNNAIQYNRWKIVKFLLDKNCRVNRTDSCDPESTPLHRAIAKKNVEVTIELLNNGASIDARDADDETPVHLAGKSRKIQIVNALMPYISSQPNVANRQGLTYLHVACMSDSLDTVNYLLSGDVDINCAVNTNSPLKPGFTPLHFAVCNGRTEIAKVLLSAGADPDATDANGRTPLHLAFRRKNNILVKLMLKKCSSDTIDAAVVNLVDDMNISYFHIACSQNDSDILNKYSMLGVDINGCINFTSSYLPGYTPLHVAVQFRCYRTIEWLLEQGADITKRDKAGLTAVHQAFWRKEYDLLDLFIPAISEVGKYENPVDMDGVSFFHICCVRDNPDVIQRFIDTGLDVNMRIKSTARRLATCTPLLLAVKFEQPGNVDVLLKNQADESVTDIKGETVLHYLCKWNRDKIEAIVQALKKIFRGDRVMYTLREHLSKPLKILKFFVDLGVQVDVPDKSNMTPLFHLFNQHSEVALRDRLTEFEDWVVGIIMRRRVVMFKMLATLKPNFELKDKFELTLLHYLAGRDNYHIVEGQDEIAPMLLQNGEDVDTLNYWGETALYLATDRGNEQLVDILLEKKANVNVYVKKHKLSTPLAAAVECLLYRLYKPDNVNKLLMHGADINTILADGSTVLHHIFGSGKFVEFCGRVCLPLAICDLDIQERATGQTPLHLATRVGDVAAVDWLLRNGAKIDVTDRQDFDPVMYCALAPEKTGDVYYTYFQRMQVLGYKFTPSLKKLIARSEGVDEDNCFLYQQHCYKEIDRLQECVINPYCTLYSFIFRSIQEMAYYMTNEKVRLLLCDPRLYQEFPLYGPLIASKSRKALARHKILKQSVCSFGLLTSFALPETVADHVLGYLENADVMNIIDVTTNGAQATT